MNFQEIEGVWIKNGGTPGWAPLMAGIALAESAGRNIKQKGKPYTKTGWGLWQITPGNSVPHVGENAQLLTPTRNAKAAIAKFKSQGITAWLTDRVYNQWIAAGHPLRPGPKTVRKYLARAGVGLGTATTGPGQGTTQVTPGVKKGGKQPTGTGGAFDTLHGTCTHPTPTTPTVPKCVVKAFPGACLINFCQLRALTGGVLIIGGGVLMIVGVALVMAAGLGKPGPLRAIRSVGHVRKPAPAPAPSTTAPSTTAPSTTAPAPAPAPSPAPAPARRPAPQPRPRAPRTAPRRRTKVRP